MELQFDDLNGWQEWPDYHTDAINVGLIMKMEEQVPQKVEKQKPRKIPKQLQLPPVLRTTEKIPFKGRISTTNQMPLSRFTGEFDLDGQAEVNEWRSQRNLATMQMKKLCQLMPLPPKRRSLTERPKPVNRPNFTIEQDYRSVDYPTNVTMFRQIDGISLERSLLRKPVLKGVLQESKRKLPGMSLSASIASLDCPFFFEEK
ncbi:hypothetical protein EDD86DRAFT_218566 [Gorgonomyces haynaldii]|nr:hypothetical protein EDD86DRAFT_218566 [Gorgonomyces haynaldii]